MGRGRPASLAPRHARLLAAALAMGLVVWWAAVRGQAPGTPGPAPLLAAIADIEAGRLRTPLVHELRTGGDVTVTFLAKRSRGRVPRIVSDVTGWGERRDGTFDARVGRMTPVGRTGWYSLEVGVARGARIEYQIAYAVGDYVLDPHNPRRVDAPPASEFVTPGYEPPARLAPAPAGTLSEVAFDSRALGIRRAFVLYVPPGAPPEDRALAVFLDSRAAEIAPVIDDLVSRGAVEPFVAAFVGVDPPGPGAPSPVALTSFLAEELPAWLATQAGTTPHAARRGILAISFAAKDALDAAVARQTGYARLGLLIPGRRLTASDIAAVGAVVRAPLRVSILAGRYDLANVETARGLHRALGAAGHAVAYHEVPEGHSPRTWLNHLPGVLADLFPAPSRSSGEPVSRGAGEEPVTGGAAEEPGFRQQAESIDRRFELARGHCDGRWRADDGCASTLRRLHDEELALFARVRAHQFSDIGESNYWHRGRLKFPSPLAQAMRQLDPR